MLLVSTGEARANKISVPPRRPPLNPGLRVSVGVHELETASSFQKPR